MQKIERPFLSGVEGAWIAVFSLAAYLTHGAVHVCAIAIATVPVVNKLSRYKWGRVLLVILTLLGLFHERIGHPAAIKKVPTPHLAIRMLPPPIYLKPEHGADDQSTKLTAPKLPKSKKKADADKQSNDDGSGNINVASLHIVSLSNNTFIASQGYSGTPEFVANAHVHISRQPQSSLPSKCVATCDGCHERPLGHWETPVEEKYCDGDHSDDDFGVLGWAKQGDLWYPSIWPAVHSEGLKSTFDRNHHDLTESHY